MSCVWPGRKGRIKNNRSGCTKAVNLYMEESQMRKRLISFALAATIMVSTSLPAFATKKFDMSVFDGKDYVGVVTDDMTGWTFAFPRFGTIEEGGTYIVSDDDSRLSASSSLYLNDTYDFYYLDFNRTGSFASGFNSVIIKIGDNRYNFSNGQTDSTVSEGIVLESFSLPMKKKNSFLL